jgi:predicted  nucleic acid-binding Zn-ribbon protein
MDAYSSIFDEVIEKDVEFGFILKKIKQAYEFAISNSLTSERRSSTLQQDKQTLSSKLASLEAELSRSKEEARAARHLKQENTRLRREVEALTSQLKKQPELMRIPVPKLNFGSLNGECFQDEFMMKVDDFSPSWRDALHNGR